jgi:hypothetical protein
MQEGQFQMRGGTERRPEGLGALGTTRYRAGMPGKQSILRRGCRTELRVERKTAWAKA